MYYVMRFNEDGDSPRIERYTKDELEAALASGYWGPNPEFLGLDAELDIDSGLLIFKGEIVMPKPVEVVKAWEV